MNVIDILKKEIIGKSVLVTTRINNDIVEIYDEVIKVGIGTTKKQFNSGNPKYRKTVQRSRTIRHDPTIIKEWIQIISVIGLDVNENHFGEGYPIIKVVLKNGDDFSLEIEHIIFNR